MLWQKKLNSRLILLNEGSLIYEKAELMFDILMLDICDELYALLIPICSVQE